MTTTELPPDPPESGVDEAEEELLLPHPKDCVAALHALELLWDKIPRADRPKLRPQLEGLRELITDVGEYVEAGLDEDEAGLDEDEEDEPSGGSPEDRPPSSGPADPLPHILGLLHSLTVDDVAELKTHLAVLDLGPGRRLSFGAGFEELVCFDCGALDHKGHVCANTKTEVPSEGEANTKTERSG